MGDDTWKAGWRQRPGAEKAEEEPKAGTKPAPKLDAAKPRERESRQNVCIYCGEIATGKVSGHATCAYDRRVVAKALSTRSRSVRTKDKASVVTTWDTEASGKTAMGMIHVEVRAGPNGGRVNVEVMKGDKADIETPHPSKWNVLRPDAARALARFLVEAADRAEKVAPTSAEARFKLEPADAERVPAREVSLCGRCKMRPAMVIVAGETVCEKCRADVLIEQDAKASEAS